ncbi:hypothetical protein H0H93_000455 [Arthromyces matolae]|nr:hypothetical protein H0H93_000455 [Arthromyces matolae]
MATIQLTYKNAQVASISQTLSPSLALRSRLPTHDTLISTFNSNPQPQPPGLRRALSDLNVYNTNDTTTQPPQQNILDVERANVHYATHNNFIINDTLNNDYNFNHPNVEDDTPNIMRGFESFENGQASSSQNPPTNYDAFPIIQEPQLEAGMPMHPQIDVPGIVLPILAGEDHDRTVTLPTSEWDRLMWTLYPNLFAPLWIKFPMPICTYSVYEFLDMRREQLGLLNFLRPLSVGELSKRSRELGIDPMCQTMFQVAQDDVRFVSPELPAANLVASPNQSSGHSSPSSGTSNDHQSPSKSTPRSVKKKKTPAVKRPLPPRQSLLQTTFVAHVKGLFLGDTFECKWGECHTVICSDAYTQGIDGEFLFQKAIRDHIQDHGHESDRTVKCDLRGCSCTFKLKDARAVERHIMSNTKVWFHFCVDGCKGITSRQCTKHRYIEVYSNGYQPTKKFEKEVKDFKARGEDTLERFQKIQNMAQR